MADEWTAPPAGSPVWMSISASDVARAQAFYSTVFNWEFPAAMAKDDSSIFFFPKKVYNSLGGSIVKVDESERKRGVHSSFMYLLVDDLKKAMEAITANGGKAVSDAEPAGEDGSMRRFEDSEGNLMGIYALKA